LITRLECGAVEFFEPGPVSPYAVVALGAASDRAPVTIHRWDDVVRRIQQHMPPNDDD